MTPELTRIPGGYRVRTVEDAHLDVRPLLHLYRLVEVGVDHPHPMGRYWCYVSFEAAVLAATAWDPADEGEPVGWIRSGGARI